MEISKITPDEYLEMCAGKRPFPSGRALSVKGDINLSKHPLREEVERLFPATVDGDVTVNENCALTEINCWVSGSITLSKAHVRSVVSKIGDRPTRLITADGCSELVAVEGWYKNASLCETGVVRLANLVCEERLCVERCKNLETLDCTANSLVARDCSVSCLGPRLAAREVFFDGCKNLKWVGEIQGLEHASFDSSGLESVWASFACSRSATFHYCRDLKHLSGTVGELHATLARLATADALLVDEAHFVGCSFPEKMRGTTFNRLKLEGCDLEKLPKGLSGARQIVLKDCYKFVDLPKKIDGDLTLDGLSELRKTPEGFVVQGLTVKRCPAFEQMRGVVEKNLCVGEETPGLQKLGKDLKIFGNLVLSSDSSVRALDCRVGGTVEANWSKVVETGDDFHSEGNASFRGCQHLKTAKGFVKRDAAFTGSSLESLGADFECGGDLCLDDTVNLCSVNCTVGGSVGARWSGLKKTGPAFFCGKDFYLKSWKMMFEEFKGTVVGKIKIVGDMERLKKSGKFLPSPVSGMTPPPPLAAPAGPRMITRPSNIPVREHRR